jgi:dipeptidyl aminopeptidase/acylaminoacyl peptidase
MRHAAALLALAALSAAAAPLSTPVKTVSDPRSIQSTINPAAKPVPLGDLGTVRDVAAAVWAPNGRSVIVSTDLTGRFNLWRVDLDESFPVQLTRSQEVQVPHAVTADGDILFTEDRGGNEIGDLYAVPLAGGAVRNLTNTPEYSESRVRVAADGRTLVVARRAVQGTAVDLVAVDRRTGRVRELTREQDPTRHWSAAGFVDGGATLVANRHDLTESRGAVYRIDMATGRATAITPEGEEGATLATDASPDGRTLAVTSNVGTSQFRAGLLDLATGKTRWLAPTPWEQRALQFSPDGATLLISTAEDGRRTLSLVDVATLVARPLPFPPGVTSVAGAQPWSRDGRVLVRSESGAAPPDLHAVDPTSGSSLRVTRLAVASLDPATLPRTEIVAYRSFDGTPISAVLTMPSNLRRDGSHPAVVIAHGGPTWQIKDYFAPDVVALASRGFIVIQPNFRGSTGYGRAFERANIQDLGGGDLEDVVHAVRFLVDTGYVDAKRIGIAGASYGGFLTLMALARKPDVFAAGVNQFGIINWFTMWEQSGTGGLREYQRMLVGDPERDREAYLRQSPMTYARQIRAPLLVLQGENDARVPKGQAEEVVQLVKANGGTVEVVYYADEGHGFAKTENQEDLRRRLVEWFERHLQGKR